MNVIQVDAMAKTTVLYHDDTDGFCAAWVARHYLPDDTLFKAVNYGQDPPWELINGRIVYVFDFSYKREATEEMLRMTERLIILDHHKTAQAALADLRLDAGDHVEFDMDRAGCRMAWDYFLRTNGGLADRLDPDDEWIVDYVQDRDLWRNELPDSAEVTSFIRSFPEKFDAWDEIANESIYDAAEAGKHILRNVKREIELILRSACIVEIAGHRVWAINTPLHVSECAGALARYVVGGEQAPFGAAWFARSNHAEFGKVLPRSVWMQFSLRSQDEFDVSEVARKFGGGGHRNAAGFEVTLKEFTLLPYGRQLPEGLNVHVP
jgi:oligoribonuclease NrnB/cAMP/cGMP phosphodiesterase (DHH superfamily)